MKRDTPLAGEEKPSKSQRKRAARELFDLGRRLVAMRPADLRQVPLDDRLRSAITGAQSITAHVARKRQLQFIAKLLRSTDPAPILAATHQLQAAAREEAARLHRVESWRDCLLAGGDRAVSHLVAARADADRQVLRQLIRAARKEAQLQTPPAAARKLFRVLREIDAEDPLPPPPGPS